MMMKNYNKIHQTGAIAGSYWIMNLIVDIKILFYEKER